MSHISKPTADDLAFKKLLDNLKIIVQPHYVGPDISEPNSKNAWAHDRWLVDINDYKFHYSTGSGHRISLIPRMTIIQQWRELYPDKNTPIIYDTRIQNPISRGIPQQRSTLAAIIPSQASIFESLLNDFTQEPLDDWYSDFSTNPVKVLPLSMVMTYMNCRENTKYLLKALDGLNNFERIKAFIQN